MTDQDNSRTLLWVVVGGGAFFLFVLAVFTLVYVAARSDDGADFGSFGSRIAVVEVEGVILDPREPVEHLKKYGDDDSVKAIVLHVNTPGGGVAASQEIYEMVKRIRQQKKKRIVAFIESVGASGGYYIASATDKIYAQPGSIVGSIGVIAQWFNYGELLTWAKLKDVTFKAGQFKDVGSPTRDVTPEERVYLQSLIDDMHTQFIDAVAEGRNLEADKVRAIADGKVWTGAQALPLHLVDQLGDMQAAIEDTAKAVGIKGEPQIVRPTEKRRTVLDLLFSDVSDVIPGKAKLLETHVGFYYLWK
jgi:protease-4